MWKFNDFWVEAMFFFNLCGELLWSCKELLWRQWSMCIPCLNFRLLSFQWDVFGWKKGSTSELVDAGGNLLRLEPGSSEKLQGWLCLEHPWSWCLNGFLVAGFLSHCSHASWWHPSPFRGWSAQHRSRNAHGLCLWLPFWGISMLTAFLLRLNMSGTVPFKKMNNCLFGLRKNKPDFS